MATISPFYRYGLEPYYTGITGTWLVWHPTHNSLYISLTTYKKIIRLSLTDSPQIFDIAGSGEYGYFDHSSDALKSKFMSPEGIAIDINGDLIVADVFAHRIRKVILDDNGMGVGVVTVAGSGAVGPSLSFVNDEDCEDGGAVISAKFNWPKHVAVDSENNIYVSDYNNRKIKKITPQGKVETILSFPDSRVGSIDIDKNTDSLYGVLVNVGTATTPKEQWLYKLMKGSSEYTNVISIDPNRYPVLMDVKVSPEKYNDNTKVFISIWDGLVIQVTEGGSVAQVASGGGAANMTTLVRPKGLAVDAGDNIYIMDEGGQKDIDQDSVAEKINPRIMKLFVIRDVYEMIFYKGWNFVCAPLNDSSVVEPGYNNFVVDSVDELAYKITVHYNPNLKREEFNQATSIVTELQMFDNNLQIAKSYIFGFGGDNFEIDGYNGYFVRLKDSAPISGVKVKTKGIQWRIASLPIKKGINWVNLSQNFYKQTAGVFRQSFGDVTEIQRYDAETQSYQSVFRQIGNDFDSGDFHTIELGKGYILVSKKDFNLVMGNVNS